MSFALHFLELRCKDMLKFLNIQSIWRIIFKKKRLLLAYSWQSEDFNSTTTIKILSVIKMDSGSIFYYQTKR